MAEFLPFDPDPDDQKFLAQVLAHYHATLKQSPEAIAYLRGRGIGNHEAVDQFLIGYGDHSLTRNLPGKRVKAGLGIRTRLQLLGLYRPSGHEHFNGYIVFPIPAADGSGRIVDVYGRRMQTHGLRREVALDLHLNTQRRGVWNIEGFKATDEIILCASVFDALAFWVNGLRNVACTFSPDTLTDDLLATFAQCRITRVVVSNLSLVPGLTKVGLSVYQLPLPHGASVEKYARHVDHPEQALKAALRAAELVDSTQQATIVVPEPDPAPPSLAVPTIEHSTDAPPEVVDVEPENTEDPQSVEMAATRSCAEPEQTDQPDAGTGNGVLVTTGPRPAVADLNGDEVVLAFGDRRFRVRGWAKNLSYDVLRVNLLATNPKGMFVDTLDLYSSKHRRSFVAQAAQELEVEQRVLQKDLGRVLLQLEELQHQRVAAMLEPKEVTPAMSEEERNAALAFLRDPHLLDRIVTDFSIVGEPVNKLVGYLAAVSRKLDQPLAVVIQSSTAAGKTTLMDAVLSFVPPEDQIKYSAITGQALFYMGAIDLRHKVLALVEEEGAERASYALKLLQSEGQLTIASTGKDVSGRLTTQEYRVEGPVMLFLTTSSTDVDEELLNRCLVLTVDEDREQTRAIHRAQRQGQTLAGQLAGEERMRLLNLHRNAQRLLRPLIVANPWSDVLTFRDDQARTRRDHQKYLTLIRTVTLLHQYQRPVRTVEHQGKRVEYIEVTPQDIAIANRLVHEVFGHSLGDLPPQTRRLLDRIHEMVENACDQQGLDRTDYRFSRRDIRAYIGGGHSQLAVHLRRLEELEYLLVHKGSRGRSYLYELLYEKPADDHQRVATGLIDVTQLPTRDLPAEADHLPVAVQPLSGSNLDGFRPSEAATFLNQEST
jgi:DNA primase